MNEETALYGLSEINFIPTGISFTVVDLNTGLNQIIGIEQVEKLNEILPCFKSESDVNAILQLRKMTA